MISSALRGAAPGTRTNNDSFAQAAWAIVPVEMLEQSVAKLDEIATAG